MSSPNPAERRRRIAGSAAFRLTLRFTVIFVATLLLLGIATGLLARRTVEADIRSDVEDALEEVTRAFERAGAAGAAEAIDRLERGEEGDGLVLGHVSADGRLLAGLLDPPKPVDGWSVFLPSGTDEDEALWVRAEKMADGSRLAVAASSEGYHDVVELLRAGAVWTVVIALPLALVSGAGLSLAVMRRLAPIAGTAAAVGKGDLSRRAPLSGRGDEFDRLAADLNAMLDRIEALHVNLRNVTIGIAHELRTPLSRARTRLTDLAGRSGGDVEQEAVAVVAEIDALLMTFDSLLKIGQIEADATRRGLGTVALSDLVAELGETYEPVVEESGRSLAVGIAPGIAIRGDRQLLAQMVSNLIENAIEHTPPGTRIRLALERTADGPLLVVEDDGPGIPPAEAERVFDRFHRLEQERVTAGNGLGLSLVRSICGLHGFEVRLGETGAGARFEVAMQRPEVSD